jgi:hypothetical protein
MMLIQSRNASQRRSARKRELSLARLALEFWLCHHAAGPSEVVPHVLRTLANGVSDEFIEAASQAASELTERRHTYGPDDIEIVAFIAKRKAVSA